GGNSPDEDISEQELAQLEEKVEQARLMFARSEEIKKSLAETITELEDLRTYVPNRSDRYAWAYEYVSRRAVKTGLELDRVDEIMYVGDETKELEKQVYEISLSTQCGYNKLVEFLWRIESGNPLLRVKDVDISKSPDGPDQQQVKVVLQWPAVLKIERGSNE
ncbi:MAG TPA: hypothetical protein VJ904_11440, partial [Tichowtungia sp.]|nr:hypothetical protein [Tichowtungia sp.]